MGPKIVNTETVGVAGQRWRNKRVHTATGAGQTCAICDRTQQVGSVAVAIGNMQFGKEGPENWRATCCETKKQVERLPREARKRIKETLGDEQGEDAQLKRALLLIGLVEICMLNAAKEKQEDFSSVLAQEIERHDEA